MPLVLKLLGVVVVTTYMLEIGLGTPTGALRLRGPRRSELARALVVMLVLGPLASRLVAAAFTLAPRPGAALVLLSLAGVVPLASRSARTARGDVSFAVELTVALGVVSAFTAAPTTRLLLGYRGPLQVRTGQLLLEILLLQAVPLALGLLVRARTERARSVAEALRVFNTAAIVVIVIVAAILVPRYAAVRSLGWKGVLAAFVFTAFMAAAGYALAGPRATERRTLAAVANKPNVVLALVIVTSAGVDAGFAIAIVGVFLVRLFTGIAIQAVLARRAATADEHAMPPQTV